MGLPPTVLATDELLAAGTVIDSDYVRMAETVQVDGEIKGDAFLVGGLVTVNGKVDGDLFVLGGKVNINGQVGESIRVLGGDVTVNTGVGRNILLLCGNCVVTQRTDIPGSLLVAAGNFELAASRIGKGFRYFGNRLYLNSEIAHEAFVVAEEEFLLGPKASVSGDLKYTGGKEVIISQGATVSGTILYQRAEDAEEFPRFFGAKALLESYKRVEPVVEGVRIIVSLAIGYLLLGLFSKWFEKVTMAISKRPVAALGWGMLVAAGLPVIAVLLAITIVGIPITVILAIIAYLGYVAAGYLVSFYIGRRVLLPRFGERRGWAMLVGLVIFYLIGLIPVLGQTIKVGLSIWAIGGAVIAYRQPTILQLANPYEKREERVRKGIGRPRKRS